MTKKYSFGESNSILEHPDGSVEIDVLEALLHEAELDNLKEKDKIKITLSQRIEDFDVENPEWEEVKQYKALNDLKKLYKSQMGFEYGSKETKYDSISGRKYYC